MTFEPDDQGDQATAATYFVGRGPELARLAAVCSAIVDLADDALQQTMVTIWHELGQ